MIGPLSRIILRYVAGFLVLKAILPQDIGDMIANDPDLAVVIGGLIMAGVEGAYFLARRWGWRT